MEGEVEEDNDQLTICSDLSAFSLMSIIFANNCWIACWASSSAWYKKKNILSKVAEQVIKGRELYHAITNVVGILNGFGDWYA